MSVLSVCAETVFLDRPFTDRVQAISDAGFAVDFWRWTDKPVDELARMTGIRWASFVGWVGGSALHPDGVDAFLDGCRASLQVAARLGCTTLIAVTGELDERGHPVHAVADNPITRWTTARDAYGRLAELAAEAGVTYCLENLNTKVDHPGYQLPRVADTAAMVRAVGHPSFRVLFDVYHAQVEEGNLIATIRSVGDLIGLVQVADVPGRHEPGTGEIDYPRVAAELRAAGYDGPIGLEAYPAGHPELAIERFRAVFAT